MNTILYVCYFGCEASRVGARQDEKRACLPNHDIFLFLFFFKLHMIFFVVILFYFQASALGKAP